MIPMADNFNHSDVNTINEIVSKSLHLSADPASNYFTKTKFMNDYSSGPIFAADELISKGRLNKDHYEIN
jgi:hypothetical protein